jgi:hypothetical protein
MELQVKRGEAPTGPLSGEGAGHPGRSHGPQGLRVGPGKPARSRARWGPGGSGQDRGSERPSASDDRRVSAADRSPRGWRRYSSTGTRPPAMGQKLAIRGQVEPEPRTGPLPSKLNRGSRVPMRACSRGSPQREPCRRIRNQGRLDHGGANGRQTAPGAPTPGRAKPRGQPTPRAGCTTPPGHAICTSFTRR